MKLLYSIHKCDVFMFTWLLKVRLHDSLTKVGRVVSKTGDGQLYVLIFTLTAWQLGFENTFVQAMLLAFLIERPVYFVLKNGFKRNRPQAALENFRSSIIPSDQFSFPSGHTSAAFMMATLLGYSVPELLIPLYCWSALVGFSRIVLGVHFPTDTLIGALLGICTALFSLAVVA